MPYAAIQTEAMEISAKNAVIGFQRCLTFITECSVTNKTLEWNIQSHQPCRGAVQGVKRLYNVLSHLNAYDWLNLQGLNTHAQYTNPS